MRSALRACEPFGVSAVSSCLYEGSVRHRRRAHVRHEFRYRLFMVYLDLDELPRRCSTALAVVGARPGARVVSPRATTSATRPRRSRSPCATLVPSARARARDGPIRLLTHLRYFGHCFNPVSFYYCFDDARRARRGGRRPGHQHALGREPRIRAARASTRATTAARRLMAGTLREGAARLAVDGHGARLRLAPDGAGASAWPCTSSPARTRTGAACSTRRSRCGAASSRGASSSPRALARYPLLTMRIVARIYGHALRLRLKRRARTSLTPAAGRAPRERSRRHAADRRGPADRARGPAAPHRARASSRSSKAASAWRSASCSSSGRLRAVVQVHDGRFYRELLRGSVGVGESYMDGLWDCDDLVALTRIAALNVRRRSTACAGRSRPCWSPCSAGRAGWRATRRARSRGSIAAHYDLGNELFALFLDQTMMYSCAVFETPGATLERGVAGQARAHLREAGPRARGSRAGDRHRLGRLRDARGASATAAA